MKKFGTPTAAAPGNANENVGFAVVGTPGPVGPEEFGFEAPALGDFEGFELGCFDGLVDDRRVGAFFAGAFGQPPGARWWGDLAPRLAAQDELLNGFGRESVRAGGAVVVVAAVVVAAVVVGAVVGT